MSECTCGSKTFLHNVTCNIIVDKLQKDEIEANKDNHSALYELHKLVQNIPDGKFFYIANTEEGAVAQYKQFKDGFHRHEWQWTVGIGSVYTIMFSNDSEVTFLPESEAVSLLHQPLSNRIFIEQSSMSKDFAEVIAPNTAGFVFVNPETKDIIS